MYANSYIQDDVKFKSLARSPDSRPVDFLALRAAEEASPMASFRHGEKLLNAIKLGKSTFETREIINDAYTWNLTNNDYKEMIQKALYETRTLYTLDPPHVSRYVNLDSIDEEHVKKSILEFSDEHIVHCNWDVPEDASGGAFIVGSSQGLWSAIPHVNRVLEKSLSLLHPDHAETKRSEGLLAVRRVTNMRRHSNHSYCVHLQTENILPHELFSKMRIESIGESPFQHTREKKEKSVADGASDHTMKQRELFSNILPTNNTADTVKSCGESYYFIKLHICYLFYIDCFVLIR